MKIIGLAGGSGTGKTTVADHLERRGAGRIDADKIVHEVLRTDEKVRRAIGARFGSGVFANGEVNRRALADIVFADPLALADLQGIVHPPVIAAFAEAVERFRASVVRLVVIDAALLLEVPLPFEVDLMIALRCARDERLRRLRAAGVPEKVIHARLASQANLETPFDRADIVLDTEKPKEELFVEIDRIIEVLLGEPLS